MRSRAALLVVVLALLLPPGPAATAQSQADDGRVEAAAVTMDVRVAANGDAHWNVSTAFALNSTNETVAFERLAAEFEADGSVGFSASEFRDVKDDVAETTGRSMGITDVERVAYVVNESGNRTGVLSLRFTWTNFARVQGQRVVLGDAFATGWLSHLGEDQRLQVHSPANYGTRNVLPVDGLVRQINGTITWEGPVEFAPGEPSVVFIRGIETTPGGDGTTTPAGPVDPDVEMALIVLLAALAFGLFAYVVTQEVDFGPDDGSPVEPAEPPDDDPAEPAVDGPESRTPPDGDEVDDGDAASPTDDDADEAVDDADEVDPELLSDEERVERLLRQNGGRMKQANVVTETGWSNAKVSQLLSAMDEDGRVDKLRIGRENLITLTDGDEDDA